MQIRPKVVRAASLLSVASKRLAAAYGPGIRNDKWVISQAAGHSYRREGRNNDCRLLLASASIAAATAVSASNEAETQNAEEPSIPGRVGVGGDFEKAFPKAFVILKKLLGDRCSTALDDLSMHGEEVSGYVPRHDPQLVVWPKSTEEVSAIVKVCAAHHIPLIPYGAGTSLEGHTVAMRGGVSMNFSLMKSVVELHKDDMDVVVQPGLGWVELNEHLEPHGLFLGADPAPGACIGGMCGTCCSGTNAVRYGTMKDQVVNLTVVLADGSVVKTLRRPRKSSAGYDLARIFVGSEGTLGIVTEATLRLRSIPEHSELAYVYFDNVYEATSAVIEILQQGIQMGAIEIMDETMNNSVNHYMDMNLDITRPLVLFKFAGPKVHVEEDVKRVAAICSRHTEQTYTWCRTKEEREEMWQGRKHAFWATCSMQPGRRMMATDVAVPISRLADCITETKKDLLESPLLTNIVGHVGDGNFHVVIMFDPEDPKEAAEALRLNERMVLRAIAMDGTCTGEHGIGVGKKRYLPIELGEEAVELMRRLKRALDPLNILNPDKIVDV